MLAQAPVAILVAILARATVAKPVEPVEAAWAMATRARVDPARARWDAAARARAAARVAAKARARRARWDAARRAHQACRRREPA